MKKGLFLTLLVLMVGCKNPMGEGSSADGGFDPGIGGGGGDSSDTTAPSAVGSLSISSDNAAYDRSITADWSGSPGSDDSGSWSYQIAIGYDDDSDGFDSGDINNLVDWTTIPGGSATTSYQVIDGNDGISFSPAFLQEHYFSVRLIDAAGNTSSATSSSAWYTFRPNELNLLFWVDASDRSTTFTDNSCTSAASNFGDAVRCITDKGPDSRDVTTTTNPASIGNDGVVFNGTSSVLTNAALNITASDNVSFFLLIKADTQSTAGGSCCRPIVSWVTASGALYPWLGLTRGNLAPNQNNLFFGWSGSGLNYTPTTPGNTYMVGARHDGGNSQWNAYLFGQRVVTNHAIPGSYTTADFGVGGDINNGARRFAGEILEVIFVNEVVNDSTQENIEGYLACKWDFRSELPVSHTFYNADDNSNAGCP